MSGATAGLAEAERRALPWLQTLLAAERGRFVLWLPVFMGAGVACYFSLRLEPAWWAGTALTVPAFAGVCLARGRLLLRAGLLALLATALGFTSAQLATFRALPLETLPKTATVVTGVVRGVELLPAGRRVSIEQARLEDVDLALRRWVRVRLRNADETPLEEMSPCVLK